MGICDAGTLRDIVAEPALVDMTRPEDLAQLREKMVEYARKLNAHQKALVCMDGQLDRIQRQFAATSAALVGLGQRVVLLESLTATHTSQIATINATLLTLAGADTSLGTRVTANEGAIVTIQAQITDLDGHVHTITLGTTGGGEAVELVGGAGGTLNTTSGGSFDSDPFDIP